MTNSFFPDLTPIKHFSEISNPLAFQTVPKNWIVVVSDIVDSTEAVNSGRYKEVNMAAGCVVAAVLNSAGSQDLPFCFGGDGASLLIPADSVQEVKQALVNVQMMIRDQFALEMRVGLVPVQDIVSQASEILVARLELSPGNSVALIRGGGVELAEDLIKSAKTSSHYLIADVKPNGLPDLSGLSCRWEPLQSRNGFMVCILVQPVNRKTAEQVAIFQRILDEISEIVGGNLNNCSPVDETNMKFRWPPRGLVMEARATRGRKAFAKRFLEVLIGSFIQLVLETLNLKGGNYDAPIYREELRTNSDYCRLDDTLRIVIDCTSEQINSIEALLNNYFEQGEIDFGSFKSPQALMTCLVNDLSKHQHLHFIDGSNGGFWSASKDLKQRKKNRISG
ncbi:MAG: hypothetical protein ACI8P9_003373 [Parasphingorhabdus sp.]